MERQRDSSGNRVILGVSRRTASRHPTNARESLVSLLYAIVEHADQAALRELIQHRPFFRLRSGQNLRLSEFLDAVRSGRAADGDIRSLQIADWAYDQTLARFSHLPEADSPVKHQGPDCRNYYRAALRKATVWRQEHPEAKQLEEEDATARILQSLVVRHYHLSKRDYFRRPGSPIRRYVWQLAEGRYLTLYRPAHIRASELRNWLETRFADVKIDQPGEVDHIQAEIDTAFPALTMVSWDVPGNDTMAASARKSPVKQVIQAEQIHASVRRTARLVDEVTAEKVEHIDRQRPAIRRLGCEQLRALIERVFRDIGEDTYQDHTIAKDFGLSKATFSRFAGSRWSEALGDGDHSSIPDLWRNLAHIMAVDVDFLVAAAEAGVLSRLKMTLTALGEALGETDNDHLEQ